MTLPLASEVLRSAFISACRAELDALKPGNVHVHGAGHGMEASHFEDAALAAAPWIADPSLKVGLRVRRAVEASLAAAGCNTNLGIVLLCAPLSKAAQSPPPAPSPLAGDVATLLRRSLAQVLLELDREDAADVYEAILRANPAGLGTAEREDVSAPPAATLREAMALAAGRDRIARAYVTDFEDVFAFGLPELERARRHAVSGHDAVTTLHMSYLAAFPDSHIARKHGAETACSVHAAARQRERLWRPSARPDTHGELLAFDRELKARGLNPGTTADFVVATLFAETIIARSGPNGGA